MTGGGPRSNSLKRPLENDLVKLMSLRLTLSHLNESPTLTMIGRLNVVVERIEILRTEFGNSSFGRETTWRTRLSKKGDQGLLAPNSISPKLEFTQTMKEGSSKDLSQVSTN